MAYKKRKDYDDVKIGGFRVLPANGYVCRILKAEDYRSKSGRDMLKVAFDIEEGDYRGYFREQFNDRKDAAEDKATVKWPFNGTKWIFYEDSEGHTSRDFKSFCTALEDSGNIVWGTNDELLMEGLKDAQVGIIFRREEHEYMNQTSWRTVPFGFRSVDTIRGGKFNVPDDKPLPPKFDSFGDIPDSFAAAEDDIPF